MMMKKMILTLAAIVAMTGGSFTTHAAVITQFGWSGEINATENTNILLETGPSFVTPTDFGNILLVEMDDLQLVPMGGTPVPPTSFDFAQLVYEDGFNIYSLADPNTALVTGDIDLTGQTLDVLTSETAAIITAITDVTLNINLTPEGVTYLAGLPVDSASADVLNYIDNNSLLRFNLTLQTTQNGEINIAQLINDGLLGQGATYSATAVAIPEPASLSLLALGALTLTRRPRKN